MPWRTVQEEGVQEGVVIGRVDASGGKSARGRMR